MNKNIALSIPNPFAYFMEFSPKIKMAIIVGFVFVLTVFMYFTYQAGYWGLFMEWLFGAAKDIKI